MLAKLVSMIYILYIYRLADLVTAYIFQNSEDLFASSVYYGTYRDGGLRITNGIESTDEICDWLDKFQERANTLCGSDCLKFTMEIWNPDAPQSEKPRNKREKLSEIHSFRILIQIGQTTISPLKSTENPINF